MSENPYQVPNAVQDKHGLRQIQIRQVLVYVIVSQLVFWSQVAILSFLYMDTWTLQLRAYFLLISIFQTGSLVAWKYLQSQVFLWLPTAISIGLISWVLRREFGLPPGELARAALMLVATFGFFSYVAHWVELNKAQGDS
jgi:hypothetical protein